MNLLHQKEHFKDHVATFQDFGNIKVLDFRNPDSIKYAIRFIFEEDHYRLHVSGDLGELIAFNQTNMRYETFGDFVDNTGYFEEKICCHNRPIYCFDREKAKKELIEMAERYEWTITDSYYSAEEALEEKIDEILEDFDDSRGISQKGYESLCELDPDCFEYASKLGKESTGILELYMLAFKLAQEQLKGGEEE